MSTSENRRRAQLLRTEDNKCDGVDEDNYVSQIDCGNENYCEDVNKDLENQNKHGEHNEQKNEKEHEQHEQENEHAQHW